MLDGTENKTPMLVKISEEAENAYQPEEGKIHFIPETGELILSEDMYDVLRTSTDLKAEYVKKSFEKNDLRPEHYFDCVVTDTDYPDKDPIEYTKKPQDIQYEVNFNQKLTVNTLGSDAFSPGITRMVDEIVDSINAVKAVEDAIAEVDKMLQSSTVVGDKRETLEKIKEQLQSEHTLKTTIMTDAFQRGISITEQEQETLNVAIADIGGRYKRLQLTESRLSDQQVDFEEMLSNNEDADLVDTIIKYSAAETVYNSSLSAASKLVQTSLLDFL